MSSSKAYFCFLEHGFLLSKALNSDFKTAKKLGCHVLFEWPLISYYERKFTDYLDFSWPRSNCELELVGSLAPLPPRRSHRCSPRCRSTPKGWKRTKIVFDILFWFGNTAIRGQFNSIYYKSLSYTLHFLNRKWTLSWYDNTNIFIYSYYICVYIFTFIFILIYISFNILPRNVVECKFFLLTYILVLFDTVTKTISQVAHIHIWLRFGNTGIGSKL